MASAIKNDRLELRLTHEQKLEIEQAAAMSGRTVTEFSVPLLVEQANSVIRQDRELQMSREAWDAFNEILEQPARSLTGLAELMKRPSVFED